MISIDEQRKRRKAMEYAIRTIEMEGFTFTEEEKKVFEDIITSPYNSYGRSSSPYFKGKKKSGKLSTFHSALL